MTVAELSASERPKIEEALFFGIGFVQEAIRILRATKSTLHLPSMTSGGMVISFRITRFAMWERINPAGERRKLRRRLHQLY